MSEASDRQPKGKGKPRFSKNNKDKTSVDKPTIEDKKAPESIKKIYKILIRKLPVREFTAEDFATCLDNVCNALNLTKENFRVEHFSEGKISRKRGPVFGAGFVSVQEESQYLIFLSQCPSKVPFIAVDDINSQPEVIAAPNQRPYRTKDRIDKYSNTFETDPDFLEFKANLEKPVEKLLSAELQMDKLKETPAVQAAQLAAQIKNNPLLKFLREKAERKIQERRALKSKGGSSSSSGKGVLVSGVMSRNSGSSGTLTKTKKSSSASREPREPREPKNASSASTGPGAKKEIRLLSRNTAVPADSPLSASLANVKPISRPISSEGGAAEEGGPPKMSRKDREREKERQRDTRRQAAGTAEGDGDAAGGHKPRPQRKERPPRGDPHTAAAAAAAAAAAPGADATGGGGGRPFVILKQNRDN